MQDLNNLYDPEQANEICGFLLDSGEVVEVTNIHPEPSTGFEIEPETVLEYMDRIKGIWHTHPNATSMLSGEDKLCMEQWPTVAHYIIGKDGVRKFLIEKGVVIHADHIPR